VDLGLKGLRALVGGASSGLGAAIATELASEGARVALLARPSERLDERAAAIGGRAIGADLSTRDGAVSAVASMVEALGGLDLLVVNSGGPPAGTFDELDEATWTVAIDGVLLAAIRLIRAGLPHLRGSDQAAILIVLSSSVREPIPGLTTSNVLRPGLAGLIKSLAAEIAPIRVNGVAPGRVRTNRIAQLDGLRAAATSRPIEEVRAETIARIPLGHYGEPADVGRLATFLLSPAAGYVTGAIVPIDGGMIRALP
jgi:3-oxoacyl-[acyl-carrier protein] reductase